MDMKKSFVISRTDHTVLKQTASRADVEQATLIAARFKAASVCVPPCYVEDAVRAADGQIRVCGVAGFPTVTFPPTQKFSRLRECWRTARKK